MASISSYDMLGGRAGQNHIVAYVFLGIPFFFTKKSSICKVHTYDICYMYMSYHAKISVYLLTTQPNTNAKHPPPNLLPLPVLGRPANYS